MRATTADSGTAAAPHAPEVGAAGRLLGRFHVTGSFWYRLHRLAVRLVPEWAMAPTILLFTAFFWLTLVNVRRAVAANLQAVLGPARGWRRQQRVFRTLHQFAWCLTERYERLAGGPQPEVELDHAERWRRATDRPGGLLLVTGHLGSWEVGSALPVSKARRAVHLVREEEMDPRAQELIAELLGERMGPGYTTHFAAAADPRLGLLLLEALARGEVVALQGDRPRRGGRVLERSLFGRPYSVPAGPLVLARTSGAPLLPVFVHREGRRRYRVSVGEPLTVARGADRGADLAAAADRFLAELEAAVRRRPHQWFCFRRLWR